MIAGDDFVAYDLRMLKKSTISKAFVEWLNAGLGKEGKNNAGLARRLGLAQTRVSEMRNYKRDPQFEELAAIAEYIEELLPAELLPPGSAIFRIPVLSIVSAGKLRNNDWHQDIRGHLNVSSLPSGGEWVAFIVEGDSMDRLSPPESTILVNRKEKKLVNDGFFVFTDKHANSSYKRYRTKPARFEPVSTNPENETIFPAADSEITVVGRVRRTILEM